MEITAQDSTRYWAQLDAHTAASLRGSSHSAPWPVQLQVSALLGDAGIEASVATFDDGDPSVWTAAIVTGDARLLWVRMQFDVEGYDSMKEESGTAQAEATVIESWARRLNDVESLHIQGARFRRGRMNQPMPNTVDLGAVTLAFPDGFEVNLGVDQTAMAPYDDRSRSDLFITALRRHVGL